MKSLLKEQFTQILNPVRWSLNISGASPEQLKQLQTDKTTDKQRKMVPYSSAGVNKASSYVI